MCGHRLRGVGTEDLWGALTMKLECVIIGLYAIAESVLLVIGVVLWMPLWLS